MANKVAALLVICLVFVAAVELPKVAAQNNYNNCFPACDKDCVSKGHAKSWCFHMCDIECFNKDNTERWKGKKV